MHAKTYLRTYQLETLIGLIYNSRKFPGETFTVMFPRQSGKNEVSACLVAALLCANADIGGSIVVCAPTLHPQASLSFDRTRRRLTALASRLNFPVEVDGNILRCRDAFATFLSASPVANVAGHTASILLLADEAQDIDSDWFNRQFRPMASSTGAPTVLLGTPWQGDSLLETAAAKNRLHDADLPTDPDDQRWFLKWHYQSGWRDVARFVPDYARFVNQERERLGEQHPIYLSQYELVAAIAERRLLSAEQLWALEGLFDPLSLPQPGERYVAGLDFGGDKPGGDATVLTIARVTPERSDIVFVETWAGLPFETVTSEVSAIARLWKFDRLFCDGTGLGASLTATLRRLVGRTVEPIVFSRPEKSALGFALQAAAMNGGLAIAPPRTHGLQTLWDELRVCRAETVRHFEMTWSAPPGAHDDAVVSLALCLRAAEGIGAPRVALGRARD